MEELITCIIVFFGVLPFVAGLVYLGYKYDTSIYKKRELERDEKIRQHIDYAIDNLSTKIMSVKIR